MIASMLQLSLVHEEDWDILNTKFAMICQRGFKSTIDVSSQRGSVCVPSTPSTTRSSQTSADLSFLANSAMTLRRRKVAYRQNNFD